MEIDIFNHAMKLLGEKKEEFKAEIELVNDEITTLKNTFIRENAVYKLHELVRYVGDSNYYNILSISVNPQGEIIYDIGEMCALSPGNDYFRADTKVLVVDVNEYSLIKMVGGNSNDI